MLMPDAPSSAVPAFPDTLLRGRLRWLIAVPAGVAALLFVVVASYLWAGGTDRSEIILIAGFLVAAVGLIVVAGQAVRAVREVDDRLHSLHAEAEKTRSTVAAAQAEAAEARSDAKKSRTGAIEARADATDAQALAAEARAEADRLVELLREAEARPVPVRTADGRQVEVFVNLSRRLQSLVHREIKLLDALENEVEDPDLLKGLFQVDHLATRIRRHAENLAVLGGAVSRRQWSRPVALTEVLRSAIAEVEHYSRVKLVPPIDGNVPGHAVASIIHLVAELIENATMFAPPQTQVLLRSQQVTAGVAIEVEDRGLGMHRPDQERVNRLLLNPEDVNLDELLQDGRIGLFVVSMIARQYGVTVQLQGNIYGGTQAVVILPHQLIGAGRLDELPVAAQQALTQQTMELARRVPGPSEIASQSLAAQLAPAPTWSAFSPSNDNASVPVSAAPTSNSATSLFATPTPQSAPPNVAPPQVAPPQFAPPLTTPPQAAPPQQAPAGPVRIDAGQEPLAPIYAGPVQAGPPTGARPPLPRRHSQTHLAPQLQAGPPPLPPESDGDHDPSLMASYMHGVSRSDAAAEAEPGTPESR
jgi:hypothetical protein